MTNKLKIRQMNHKDGRTRSKYQKMMKALEKLRGIPAKNKNLICLLHGSGGSGKSTVINTVKSYAAEFCKLLGHPFTTQTIVVTAMPGVAATLIGGETIHSVLGLNRDTIQNEERAEWLDARLLIIDEISFASASDFEKMHSHLVKFTGDWFHIYGGAVPSSTIHSLYLRDSLCLISNTTYGIEIP